MDTNDNTVARYGGMGDTVSPYYGGSLASYPTGTVPPPHSHVPLLHQAPPR